jgi:prevent-host-death family protein
MRPMKPLRTDAMVPVSDFKASPAKYLRMLDEGPVVITVDGRAAGVLIPPSEYDRLALRDELEAALADAAAAEARGDRGYTTDEVRQFLKERRAARAVEAAPPSKDKAVAK